MATLPPKKVLIVEDNAILAAELLELVEENGASPVGPAYGLSQAMEIAQQAELDAALLDINLGDEFVWPFARKLNEANVPFAFVSAACSRSDMPEDLVGAICIDKPASGDEIVDTLLEMLSKNN